ncbi:MAG: ribose-phosphate diphosphokinase [Pseudohongiellaceae bacterium]
MNKSNQAIPIVFSLQPHPLLSGLVSGLSAQTGGFETRYFPDGESYLRIETQVEQRQCIILANLAHPNEKFLPLAFMASTLKELGAESVGLVAPYLSYMRQDRRFEAGEAVTSRIFATLLSQQIDWFVTVDPHLHRVHSLQEIYTVPSTVVEGAPIIGKWLRSLHDVFLVGPDSESEQWVSQISAQSGHPFVIGEKRRHGDRDVTIVLPDLSDFTGLTAVIIDDVISSGHTILQCLKSLNASGVVSVSCVCIHGLFADGAEAMLASAGLKELISTNTIPHQSNRLDVAEALLPPIQKHLSGVTLHARGQSAIKVNKKEQP